MPDHSPESPNPHELTDSPITWWRPGWRDVVTSMGTTRLVVLTAATGLMLLLAALTVVLGWPVWFAGSVKPLGFLIAGAISIVAYMMRCAVQARKEPFCVFCGYNLTGLPDHYRCPECGRPYTWAQIEEYRRDPQWFIDRWKARQTLPQPDPPVEIDPAQPRRRSRDGT